jgi:hypothetical protein
MAKEKTFTIPEKNVKVIEDALRIALSTVSTEYHEKPSKALARRMDDIEQTLDIFR